MTPRICGRPAFPAASTVPPAATTRGAPTAGRRSSRSSRARACTARRSPTSAGRVMPSIDIHAHLMPQCLWRTVATGSDWYGTRYEPGDGLGFTVTQGKRSRIATPKVRFTPEERLEDMDAEAMGAVLFFHPQPQHNFLLQRTERYGLANSLGVIVEDTLIVAILIFGGILDACPDLKVCIAHGGGVACFGMGRLDRGWQVRT